MGMEPKGTTTIEYLPELLRIPLPVTSVNKGKKKGRSLPK
jgi:hypothetical protein